MSTPKIEMVRIDKLIPYARNARTHSDEQISQIAGSIKEFGFTNPVLIDDQNGIIAGHGRVMAARILAYSEVPCIRLSHLSETQRRAYILADNRIALNSGWDESMLALELTELNIDGFNLGLLGFNEAEIDALGVGIDEMAFPDLSAEDKPPYQEMTFTIHDSQVDIIQSALAKAKAKGEFDGPNENSNGNALARICSAYCEA